MTSLALSLPRVTLVLSLTPLPLALPLPCISSLARVFNRQRDWERDGECVSCHQTLKRALPNYPDILPRVCASAIIVYENVEE